MQLVENQVVIDRPAIYHTHLDYTPECDCCGCHAKLRIYGEYRCWDCAEDGHGIVRVENAN